MPPISIPLSIRRFFLLLVIVAAGWVIAGPTQMFAQTRSVSDAQIVVIVGKSQRPPIENKDQSLKYESGNAGFFTVNEHGVMHGIHEGESSLTVTAADGAQTEFRVTVVATKEQAAALHPATAPGGRQEAVEDIVVSNAGGEIEVGFYQRIIAYLLPYEVIGSSPFSIHSSDPSVLAALDEVKLVHALKPGTATVTVATLDGKHKASVTYTIIPARTESHSAEKTYKIEPARFGIRYDDASEEAAKANSAGIYAALLHTAKNGFTRLLLEQEKMLYIEPKDTIHMVSNVQLDLNGSELRLRPNNYERYSAISFANKEKSEIIENASIVNGTLTGERDEKEKHLPGWAKIANTEGGCTLIFEEGVNNGIRNLTVRKSIGFNISSRLGRNSHGVVPFSKHPIKASNLEQGGFNAKGEAEEVPGLIRTITPLDISALQTPYYNIGFPLGYMGYPHVNSRIYDVYFFDEDMKLLSSQRGQLRYRQYALPKGAAYMQIAFYLPEVPANVQHDLGDAVAFVGNRAMPFRNYMIDCTIEDNFSTGFAACGGQEWLILNNTFRRNGGRMPGCDIDWEDGWEYMQGDFVAGNRFESRVNVITCAGLGLVFYNNTFRGRSIFYGRTQHYSLLENIFEKAEGENAYPTDLSLSASSDIYSARNQFRNASINYNRQHAKAPFIGTYEATFTQETFDGTKIGTGLNGRLVDCTILNPEE